MPLPFGSLGFKSQLIQGMYDLPRKVFFIFGEKLHGNDQPVGS
jgi:hypothetical protein